VEVLKKLSEEKGYDLVVESTVTYFSKAPMDITAEATAAYDKAYPVGSAPAAGAKPAK
jgi:outer membrane protein